MKLLAISVLLTVAACTTQPTKFTTGQEVNPPAGCIEYRLRGGDC